MADVSRILLADTSAWHRSSSARVYDLWRRNIDQNRVATTPPVLLEILFSARSGRDHDDIARELGALHQLPCGDEAWARALDVQRQLAHRRALHHRSVQIPDLLVAAVAEIEGAIVWHYDSDFDRIAEVTGQPMQWLVPRGSL